jgi:DNA replication and repair protein RecF
LKIHNLLLVFFKNHAQLKWAIDAEVVGIDGLNGRGKTNVLDAIYYICTGKSYFSATDVQCIANEELAAGIVASIGHGDLDEVKIKFKRGSRKTIEKNGVAQKKVMDYLGSYYAVVIAPGDIALVYGANEIRRSFVNQILSQSNKPYLEALVKYNKLIEHRNKHLKEDDIDEDLIAALDKQIAPFAQLIYDSRKLFLEQFIPVFQTKYNALADNKEQISLIYESQLHHTSYQELVKLNRRKDAAVQRSFSGIHKDELEISLNEMSLKKFGSQGQIKSALIALKLAEYEYISQKLGFMPFLLLDDIFEKIDDKRALVLTQLIKKGNFGQVFITDTNAERIEAFCVAIDKKYQLEHL